MGYAIFSISNRETYDADDELLSFALMMSAAKAMLGKKRQKVLIVQFVRLRTFDVIASISALK
jgi:hypothetical protein